MVFANLWGEKIIKVPKTFKSGYYEWLENGSIETGDIEDEKYLLFIPIELHIKALPPVHLNSPGASL
ncbi:hypothetical protein OBV_35360 [Oscillibacter valericigenes Sjm18-20]|nr:hypothetical protein OBV_35360 [Oscillibacter valericigenes Sjm18-20]